MSSSIKKQLFKQLVKINKNFNCIFQLCNQTLVKLYEIGKYFYNKVFYIQGGSRNNFNENKETVDKQYPSNNSCEPTVRRDEEPKVGIEKEPVTDSHTKVSQEKKKYSDSPNINEENTKYDQIVDVSISKVNNSENN